MDRTQKRYKCRLSKFIYFLPWSLTRICWVHQVKGTVSGASKDTHEKATKTANEAAQKAKDTAADAAENTGGVWQKVRHRKALVNARDSWIASYLAA